MFQQKFCATKAIQKMKKEIIALYMCVNYSTESSKFVIIHNLI